MVKSQKTIDRIFRRSSDEQILQLRIKDIGLQLQGSEVEPHIERLYGELSAKGLCFRPPCYLSDEWLTPDKIPIVGIPFILAHQRLKKIEKKIMLEVEGGTEKSFMKLLRHECGHAINYAYQLYKKTRWRELFGPFSLTYKNSYVFHPYSKRYVVHLTDHYAQSHPDEDFAETFAVWLDPFSNWEKKYQGWPAIRKLKYVDSLMKRIGPTKAKVTSQGRPPFSANRMTSTLQSFYERKKKSLGPDFQGFYDDSLRQVFFEKNTDEELTKASSLLRQYRRHIINSVSLWAGHRKYDISQLMKKIISRCDSLGLYAHNDQSSDIIALTALLTSIASQTFRNGMKGRR
jgi:hypothetical protein